MEDFILSVNKEIASIIKITNLLEEIEFFKGEFVFHNSFLLGTKFKIINILFPINGNKIILLESCDLKFRFLANPLDLIKIQ